MGPFDLLNHLLNFIAPAAWVAGALALSARIFIRKRPVTFALKAQAAINFAVCLIALVVGLLVFGRDGKMATYAAMVVLGATSQCLMLRAWR